LWCGPSTVNFKKKDKKIGYFGYEEVLPKLLAELDRMIAERTAAAN
jgi:(E)-4-hydroxy-3-methylbut-2-enyl-diphosphate synthase